MAARGERFELRPNERRSRQGSLLNCLPLRRKLLLEAFAASPRRSADDTGWY